MKLAMCLVQMDNYSSVAFRRHAEIQCGSESFVESPLLKVLLVDDHVLFREGIALLLPSLVSATAIVQAGTCEEALTALAAEPDISLVLMDLSMPGMGGLVGIPILRERFPDVPVVALSSNDDRTTVLQALDSGAMGFIPKTTTSEVLGGALKLVLSKGIYLPPSVFLADALRTGERAATFTAPAGQVTERPRKTPADLGLTPRQSDVLYLILQGKPAKSICRDLGVSASTVKAHTSAVLRALNVTTRTQAIVAAGRLGLTFESTEPR
jgi:DNA-binding NarL/FixJ family response regulator